MKLQRFFIFLLIITATNLVYVRMQVEIVKLAYVGKAKETKLKDLLDTRSILVYNINRLESAQNVGNKVLCSQTDLQFTDKDQIALLRLPLKVNKPLKLSSANSRQRKGGFFVNLFSLKSLAEATEKAK